MKFIRILFFLTLIINSNILNAQKTNFPTPIGVVSDYGEIYTDSQISELSEIILEYRSKTTNQIAVLTVNEITPYTNVQRFAVDLGNYWGVGAKEKNNGLTIVICNPCREIGITTGIGTELILTDKICRDVIENTIIPEFKNGEFYEGIKKGILELIEKWN